MHAEQDGFITVHPHDRDAIVAEYEQQEAKLGGPGMAKEAIDATAAALGRPAGQVADVVFDHWVPRG